MRIVPILRDIGLWGPKLREAFTEMGVIGWADADIDAEMASDEKAAQDLDEERDVRMAHVERWPRRPVKGRAALADDRVTRCREQRSVGRLTDRD